MKRLLLLRHAKAVQDGKDGADDHARELTGRGRKDAAHIGAWLHERGFVPDLTLCSTSARTRATWESVVAELGGNPDIDFMKQLYLAPAKTILAAVQSRDDDVGTLMTVGHNPGTEDVARLFSRAPIDKNERTRVDLLKSKFPTAALAVLDFEAAHWREVRPGSGTLAAFVRPKDLDD